MDNPKIKDLIILIICTVLLIVRLKYMMEEGKMDKQKFKDWVILIIGIVIFFLFFRVAISFLKGNL